VTHRERIPDHALPMAGVGAESRKRPLPKSYRLLPVAMVQFVAAQYAYYAISARRTRMAVIAAGGLHHETNTFAVEPATLEAFIQADGWPGLTRGAGLADAVAGINLPITGFIDEARALGHALKPLLWANACPTGPVAEDAYERLVTMLQDDLAAAEPFDALFLDLHGAMVADHLPDGEGELLRRARPIVGRRPIVVALDLHANVSDAMVAHADLMIAYRTYPHLDFAETGARCARRLDRLLKDGLRPAKAHRKPPFLIPLTGQCTTSGVEMPPSCTQCLYSRNGVLDRLAHALP
jgi:microcystin degradation protein MlrC